MKKIVSDIIDEALEMAQMANSDSISYSEKVSMLNEVYQEIYQKAINNGSKDFIQEVYLNGKGSFELPDDFYQLEKCSIDDYRLENNNIIVERPCIVRYYPVPTFLSFPASDMPLSTKETNVVAGFGNRVVIDDGTDYCIYNLNTEEIEGKTPNTVTEIMIGKDYFATLESSTMTYLDFSGNVIKTQSVGTDKHLVLSNGNITYGDKAAIYWNDYVFVDSTIKEADEVLVEINDYHNGCFGYFNNHPAFTYFNGRKLVTIDLITNEEMASDNEWDNAIMLKMDNKTGYGAFVINGNNNYIVSWVPDTILNFPNNMFYSVMIYKLAEQFKIRNNEEVGQFSQMVSAKEYQFYDTIRKDISRNYIIKDVYANRR